MSGVMETSMRSVLLFCGLCIPLPAFALASESDREKLTDARDTAFLYADKFIGKDCLLAESTNSMEGAVSTKSSVNTRFDFFNGMAVIQYASEKGETAIVINDEYCFEAVRLKDKDHWMLLDYAFDAAADIDTQKLGLGMAVSRPTLGMYHNDLCGLRGLDEKPIDAEYLLNGDDVKLVSSTESEEAIECTYSREGSATGKFKGERISGTIVFSKKNHYFPESLEEITGSKSKQVERSYEVLSPHAMKRSSKDEYFEAGRQTLLISTSDSLRTTPQRRGDFTLTAFGLPEPAKPANPVNQFTIWIVVTLFGVLCVILYFLLKKWRGSV